MMQSTLMGCDQVSASDTSIGQLSTYCGNDLAALGYGIVTIPYAIAVPIECAFMIWLTCVQVGVAAAFAGLSMFFFLFPVQLGFSMYAARRRARERAIAARRLDVLSDTILNNVVVKLMNILEMMMDRMKHLCSQETKEVMWTASSYVFMLVLQIALAPWMASVSRELIFGSELDFISNLMLVTYALSSLLVRFSLGGPGSEQGCSQRLSGGLRFLPYNRVI